MYEQLNMCVNLRFDCKHLYVNKGKNSIVNYFLFFNSTLVTGIMVMPVTNDFCIGNRCY
jgi:hypothetical protein